MLHEGVLIVDWVIPDGAPRLRMVERFQELADLISLTLRRLGVDARTGSIPGEYCPGAYSVNAGGRHKIAGLAQRLYPRAAHVSAAIVVDHESRLLDVTDAVYRALGIEWDTGTFGSVRMAVPSVTWQDLAQALRESLPSADRRADA